MLVALETEKACVWSSFLAFPSFVSRFYMMNKDFLQWFHHIPFFISFFHFFFSILRRCHFCPALLIHFYRQLKPHLSVAVRMWTMRCTTFRITEWNCCSIKKNIQTLLSAYLMNMCVSVGISFTYAFSFYATLSHFSSMKILHFAFESKEHSLNCAQSLVAYQSFYLGVFRR